MVGGDRSLQFAAGPDPLPRSKARPCSKTVLYDATPRRPLVKVELVHKAVLNLETSLVGQPGQVDGKSYESWFRAEVCWLAGWLPMPRRRERGNRLVDGLSVYWKYIRSSRTAVRACSCRDVGAGGNGSRLPVCTWHGTWGLSRAAGFGLQAARGTCAYCKGSERLGCPNGSCSEGSRKPGQAEPELVHGIARLALTSSSKSAGVRGPEEVTRAARRTL